MGWLRWFNVRGAWAGPRVEPGRRRDSRWSGRQALRNPKPARCAATSSMTAGLILITAAPPFGLGW